MGRQCRGPVAPCGALASEPCAGVIQGMLKGAFGCVTQGLSKGVFRCVWGFHVRELGLRGCARCSERIRALVVVCAASGCL